MVKLFILVGSLFVGKMVHAHPHDNIEQQALLSLDLDKAVLQIRIAPSHDEGAAIYKYIDANGDNRISDDEAASFGKEIMSTITMTVDGNEFLFKTPKVSIPNYQSVSSGLGIIEVKADTEIELTSSAKHTLNFEIDYQEFSHDWFVQPFFYSNLNKRIPSKTIRRSKTDHRIEIKFSPKKT